MILAAWARQPLTLRRVAAIVVGFSGVGVIVGFEGLQLGPDALVGVVAATIAAASYGVALTYVRRRMGPQPPIQLASGQLIAAALLLLPFAAAQAGDVTITGEAIVAVTGIAVLSTAIAWPILFRLNRDVGPMASSTVTFLNPVFGALWGALFLSETISPTFLLGAALVFVSLGLILEVRPVAAVRGLLRPGADAPLPAAVPVPVPVAVPADPGDGGETA
jgi:drug/metabolite transporter (DMT)-like permease